MMTSFGWYQQSQISGLQVLTGHKDTGCTCTHHDHADVPQSEILLCNTGILTLTVTLMFTGVHFNNVMYFHKVSG
jgi:hypothetical protein